MTAMDLLAAATPRPWWRRDDSNVWSDITSEANNICVMSDGGRTTPPTADADLIVRAVNEYEAMLTVEASLRAIADFIGGQYGAHARESLAKLDEIRNNS